MKYKTFHTLAPHGTQNENGNGMNETYVVTFWRELIKYDGFSLYTLIYVAMLVGVATKLAIIMYI